MGWRGAVRSYSAVVRAAERDSKRRQSELERKRKQYAKMQELEQAAYEVEVYENHIEVIQSLHKECGSSVDWVNIATSQQPSKPENKNILERNAQLEAARYKPGFIDRLFKKEEKNRTMLAEKIIDAIRMDEASYRANILVWEQDFSDWKESVDIAKALLQGNPKAKLDAIKNLQPFAEASNLGSKLSFSLNDLGLLEATIHVHSANIVPNEIKSLLKSGKLSTKSMPKAKFNEVYQDYVCSCILRVANETFAIIPDDLVVVTAIDELLNSKTGHLEEAPILSVVISYATLKSLNLETIDPSDSMGNFIHNMSFNKTKGFDSVSRVNSSTLSPKKSTSS